MVPLLLTVVTLSGCSTLPTAGDAPESVWDPSYRDVIATYLKTTFKNYASYEAFEISDPRWVHSFDGWTWLTCVRFQDHGHTRAYAVFQKGSVIVNARYAVQTDQCDLQTYAFFERMGGFELPPVH